MSSMASVSKTSILVLGAGELGLSVLDSLATHPSSSTSSVSVLLRPQPEPPSPSKAAQLSAITELGITIVYGDLATSDVDSLAQIFRPYNTILSCTGFISGPGTQLKICNAALAAGVKRYFPWQFGIDYDTLGRGSAQELFDEQLEVRDLLRSQSATEWIIVSVGMFMSFVFEPFWGVVDRDARKVTALGSWENRVTLTDAGDIARCVAEVVYAMPRIGNEVVFIGGETISYGRLADVVEDVLGEVQREVLSVESLEKELKDEPHEQLRKYRVVFAKGKGCSWGLEKTFNFRKGMKMVRVEDWVRENLRKGK